MAGRAGCGVFLRHFAQGVWLAHDQAAQVFFDNLLLQQHIQCARHRLPAMPTQQEIAAMVNTSRETVSRALNVLLQKQIVEKDLRRLIVRQPDILRKMAQEDPAPGPAGHAGGR
jgi:CRP-like cAMP-binding protein